MTPVPYGVVTNFLKKYILNNPSWGIVLGSGWTIIDRNFTIKHKIPYHQFSHFPIPTIPGHKGELIIGELGKSPLIILSGRAHLYEGYSPQEIGYPIQVLARLGIKKMIVTNAAGAINPDFQVGEMMLIKDQINLQFKSLGKLSPLKHVSLFDPTLLRLAENIGKKLRLKLQKGVYLGVTGPNYETAAEIRMFRKIGADAVGMSTVLETMSAVHSGIKVLGISCLVNKATGLAKTPLGHQDVLRVMEKAKNQLNSLIKNVVLSGV